ncbi:MAG: helix-turn-helix domain-containing protein [Oscillospiraceae bacterium]
MIFKIYLYSTKIPRKSFAKKWYGFCNVAYNLYDKNWLNKPNLLSDTICLVDKYGISRFVSCLSSLMFDMLFLERRITLNMNQQKIGEFLKTLRKEKGLTQEQFAEIVNVSNRTVSRWENGNNMPDLDILIQLSDYYEIELRELLEGERKNEQMNKDLEDTVLKAVGYTSTQTEQFTRKINWLLLVGAILWFISQLIDHTELTQIYFLSAISDFAAGAAGGMVICGIVMTSRYGQRIKAFKQRLLKRQ